MQGAAIDVWAVGTKLITSDDCPALGGVYKLAAEEENGRLVPRIKLSDNPAKMTNPGYKKLIRIYDSHSGMAIADLIMLDHETIDTSKPLRIFDPVETWKTMKITNYTVKELLVPIFVDGRQVYESPDIHAIQKNAVKDLSTFWEAYRRLYNPHVYKVDLSQELYDTKQEMIKKAVKQD
jgi:nicotinate phosphoribosyltransferase